MAADSRVRSGIEVNSGEALRLQRTARVTRRTACAGLATAAGLLQAQPTGKVYRLGILWHADSKEAEGPMYTAVLTGLQERGWVEGRNLVIEHRFAAERPERFRSLAAELVALKPDALLGVSAPSAVALKGTGTTIPIVFTALGDAVRTGLVQSLGKPGANVTGYTIAAPDLLPKRMQLLLEVLPQTRQLGVLYNPDNPLVGRQLESLAAGSQANNLTTVPIAARDPGQIDAVIAQFAERGIKVMMTLGDALFWLERQRIADAALARRIADFAPAREGVAAGSLFCYGVNMPEVARQSTEYVTRVLKGTPPAELPVVEPSRFELVVNLRTAKALGITIPSVILLRADEVLQ